MKKDFNNVMEHLANSRGALGALLDLIENLDVNALDVSEQKKLILAIKEYSRLKNAPALLMALNPDIQALMVFEGFPLPGLDRLAPLKASPRIVLARLAYTNDSQLLSKYSFQKATKSDWIYYLKLCKELIEPCKQFLLIEPSHGGLSSEEVFDILATNESVLSRLPILRLNPDQVTRLLLTGSYGGVWEIYDFTQFSKEHWRAILGKLNPTTVPNACYDYLTNKNGKGFDAVELLELAKTSDLALDYIRPADVPFSRAYAFRLAGRGLRLWEKYPFEKISRFNWIRLIEDNKLQIPQQFSLKISDNTFSIDELCNLALKNNGVINFIPFDRLLPTAMVNLLVKTGAHIFWEKYDFKRLSATDWTSLITMGGCVVLPQPQRQMLKDVRGWTPEMVRVILKRNLKYCEDLPLEAIPTDIVVDFLLNGKMTKWCKAYPLSRLEKKDWEHLLVSNKVDVPQAFRKVAKSGLFTQEELVSIAIKNVKVIKFLPLNSLTVDQIVTLLLSSDSAEIWDSYDFSNFRCKNWLAIISRRRGMLPVRGLAFLAKVSDINTEFVEKIVRVNPQYCQFVPLNLIPLTLVVELLQGEMGPYLWSNYQAFSLLRTCDWERILENLEGAIPKPCQEYLSSPKCEISVQKINQLILKNMAFAEFVMPGRIATDVACRILLKNSLSRLWFVFDFRKFSLEQKRELLLNVGIREEWPQELIEMLSEKVGALDDESLVEMSNKNSMTLLKYIGRGRLKKMPASVFASICQNLSCHEMATKTLIAIFSSKKPLRGGHWRELDDALKVILLVHMPILRNFIPWQQFSCSLLGKLITANSVFLHELRLGRKFKYFLWRHAVIILLLVGIAIVTASIAVVRFIEQEREKKARRDVAVAMLLEKAYKLELDVGRCSSASSYDALTSQIRVFTQKPYFAEFQQEYADVWGRIKKNSTNLTMGERKALELSKKVKLLEGQYMKRLLDASGSETCSLLLKEIKEWLKCWHNVVKWQTETVLSLEKRCLSLQNQSNAGYQAIQAVNSATSYEELYSTCMKLLDSYEDYEEVCNVNRMAIASPADVQAAITKKHARGDQEVFCDFVGVVKVNPKTRKSVDPILIKDVNEGKLYIVQRNYEVGLGGWRWSVKPFIEVKRSNSSLRYSLLLDTRECYEGMGLFVCNKPEYVLDGEWAPGIRNRHCPGWIASSVYGRWIIAPGYRQTTLSRYELSPVKWVPNQVYNVVYRTGEQEGVWWYKKICTACNGIGHKTLNTRKKCDTCRGKGRVKMYSTWNANYSYGEGICSACDGRKYVNTSKEKTCSVCDGNRNVWSRMKKSEIELFMSKWLQKHEEGGE